MSTENLLVILDVLGEKIKTDKSKYDQLLAGAQKIADELNSIKKSSNEATKKETK